MPNRVEGEEAAAVALVVARVHQVAPPAAAAAAAGVRRLPLRRPPRPFRPPDPARRHQASPTLLQIRNTTTSTPVHLRDFFPEQHRRWPVRAPHLALTIQGSETNRPPPVQLQDDPALPKAPTVTAMLSAWQCGAQTARGCRGKHGPTPATKRNCHHAHLLSDRWGLTSDTKLQPSATRRSGPPR
jgi:hypothetical protein